MELRRTTETWSAAGLGTANRAQAAFEARQLYVTLKANGWDETMRRRRGDVAEKKSDVMIGEYIEAVRDEEPPAACDDRELRRGASHDRRRNYGAREQGPS